MGVLIFKGIINEVQTMYEYCNHTARLNESLSLLKF